MDARAQPIALRPLEIKHLFDFAIRLYRGNFTAMFLAMAVVQLPYALLTFPLLLKILDFSNAFTDLQVSGRYPDSAFFLDQVDSLAWAGVLMLLAMAYQVLITPLGNLACARLATMQLAGRGCELAAAFRFAATRYWPTQVAIATFVLPLLLLSIIVLLPVLAAQTAGSEVGILTSSLLGVNLIMLAMLATLLFFPRFFMALNGIIQTGEEPEGAGILAQGLWYLKRSFGLSQGLYFRLLGLLLLMFFAVYFITQGISDSAQIIILLVQGLMSGGSSGSEILSALQAQDPLAVGLGMAITTVFTLLIVPVWQCLKVLLYYDLRCRKEAYDLLMLLDAQRSGS